MHTLGKAMGVSKPLCSKAEGGLIEGARKQFEAKYFSSSAKDGEKERNGNELQESRMMVLFTHRRKR